MLCGDLTGIVWHLRRIDMMWLRKVLRAALRVARG